MLVLIGPPFEGSDEQLSLLASATGLLAYDLKTKLKPGAWGVVRALGDPLQAAELTDQLGALGFRVCMLDSAIGQDPERRIVTVRAIDFERERMVLHLRERTMPIPYRALVTIVRGEVKVGRPMSRTSSSSGSATMRAVAPTTADLAQFRESVSRAGFDAFAAADLHFATVLWVARIDARGFDFAGAGLGSQSPAADLDQLVAMLAERGEVRVDRNARVSSVASFASRPMALRSTSPVPGGVAPSRGGGGEDDEFDAYSRLIAEAERQTRRFIPASLAPTTA